MKLFVRRIGQGTPLIILHGLYGSGDNWLTIARKLADHHEVILMDQRNHGHSAHADEHNYQVLADDLLETMDDLQLNQSVILGHSMGGKAAMWFAAGHPSRIRQLIIADIGPRSYLNAESDDRHSILHRSILESMLDVDFNRVKGLGDIDRQLEGRIPEKRLRQFLMKNIEKDEISGFRWKLNLPVLLKNLDNLSAGMEEFVANGVVVNQFPILFIRGENSDFILQPDREMISRLFPEATIETIQHAGHWLHAEQPDAFLAIVNRQLQKA